ncbi:MAG: 50S ribosomal protein L18e [Candidatus Woesearchaeota archaeon]
MKNPQLMKLVSNLKKASIEGDLKLWKRVASDLEKPTRSRRVVNIYKIDKFTSDNEIIIVPGKVLSSGDLNHPVTVAAFSFSKTAAKKINEKGKAYTLEEFLQTDVKGKKVRIIG